MRSMEGIVRQILRANPAADIIFVYTIQKTMADFYDKGELPPTVRMHQKIAAHYGIPDVNMGRAIWEEVHAGKATWQEMLPDNTHPSDRGFAIYTAQIRSFWSPTGATTPTDRVRRPRPDSRSVRPGAYRRGLRTLDAPGWTGRRGRREILQGIDRYFDSGYGAEVRVRRETPSASSGLSRRIVATSNGRSTGQPRSARPAGTATRFASRGRIIQFSDDSLPPGATSYREGSRRPQRKVDRNSHVRIGGVLVNGPTPANWPITAAGNTPSSGSRIRPCRYRRGFISASKGAPKFTRSWNEYSLAKSFCNSRQSDKLLRYLVKHSLDNRDELLRERVIGVDVFGREPGYDTNEESIVRVRANELRKRLAKYYQDLKTQPSLRFTIPAGSYRVEFATPNGSAHSAGKRGTLLSGDRSFLASRYRQPTARGHLQPSSGSLWIHPGIPGTRHRLRLRTSARKRRRSNSLRIARCTGATSSPSAISTSGWAARTPSRPSPDFSPSAASQAPHASATTSRSKTYGLRRRYWLARFQTTGRSI